MLSSKYINADGLYIKAKWTNIKFVVNGICFEKFIENIVKLM